MISPEGCAGILWRDGSYAPDAAEALKLTSKDLYKLGLMDTIIPEPIGGAHRNIHDTIYNVERYIVRTLNELTRKPVDQLTQERYQKWRTFGSQFAVPFQAAAPAKTIREIKAKAGRKTTVSTANPTA